MDALTSDLKKKEGGEGEDLNKVLLFKELKFKKSHKISSITLGDNFSFLIVVITKLARKRFSS